MNKRCSSDNHYKWLVSTLTPFNKETPRLDDQNKVAREMSVAIKEIKNVLEQFRNDLQLKKMKPKKELIDWRSLSQQSSKTWNTTHKNKFQDAKVKITLMLLN